MELKDKEEIARLAAKYAVEELHKLLKSMNIKSSDKRPELEADVIKSGEVAKIMGWSMKTLYMHMHEIPHQRQGNKCYFLREKVLEYKKTYFSIQQ